MAYSMEEEEEFILTTFYHTKFHDTPSANCIVWYAISKQGCLGPIFVEGTINQ
jgi:hypothetical protein